MLPQQNQYFLGWAYCLMVQKSNGPSTLTIVQRDLSGQMEPLLMVGTGTGQVEFSPLKFNIDSTNSHI